MKKLIVCAAAALFAVSCASTRDDGPDLPPPAVTPSADPRVAELQTQMTELLERIDVLNQRIAQLEEAPVVVATPAPAPVTRTAAPAASGARPTPRTTTQPVAAQRAVVGAQVAEQYRQAIILYGRGKHAEARRAFEAVFDADNGGDLADNALFWIGETYYAAKDYTNALRYYTRVVNDYSSQNKAPDALLKIGILQSRTGDLALAKRTLQQVIERYPYSSSASSAKAELERIKF